MHDSIIERQNIKKVSFEEGNKKIKLRATSNTSTTYKRFTYNIAVMGEDRFENDILIHSLRGVSTTITTFRTSIQQ